MGSKFWFILFIGLNFSMFSQKNIELDLNYMKTKRFVACSYIKEFNYTFIKPEITLGYFGLTTLSGNEIQNGFVVKPVYSPYNYFNLNDIKDGLLTRYSSTNFGFEIGCAYGFIWKLNEINRITLDFDVRIAFVRDKFYYELTTADNIVTPSSVHNINFNSFSPGMKLCHYIKLSKKLNLFYHLKLPFYFPFRTKTYDPEDIQCQMFGFEPNIGLGLSYKIRNR